MKNLINPDELLDVAIIGAGPAGLTAAIYTLRAGYKTTLFEKEVPGGKMVKTDDIENYPGYKTIKGPDLSMSMWTQVTDLGGIVEYEEIVHYKKDEENNIFELHTNTAKVFYAKTAIIATGTFENRLGIPGEDELYGKGVSYCAVCDGAFHKNEEILVVGGGYSAVTEGLYLTKFAKTLYVAVRKDYFRADDFQVNLLKKVTKNMMGQPVEVKFLMNTVVEEILGTERVTGAKIKNTLTGEQSTLPVKAVFPYIGSKPLSNFVQTEVKDDKGYLVTDKQLMTSVKGLYAAGDVRDVTLRQIATAVGDGALAGQMVVQYLEKLN